MTRGRKETRSEEIGKCPILVLLLPNYFLKVNLTRYDAFMPKKETDDPIVFAKTGS